MTSTPPAHFTHRTPTTPPTTHNSPSGLYKPDGHADSDFYTHPAFLFARDTGELVWAPALVGVFGAILLFAAVGELMGNACIQSVEKDWVVVMAAGDKAYLTHLNTSLRRIDLLCKLGAPFLFGLTLQLIPDAATRVRAGSVMVGGWNLLGLPVEYYTIREVFRAYPSLATRSEPPKPRTSVLRSLVSGWTEYVVGAGGALRVNKISSATTTDICVAHPRSRSAFLHLFASQHHELFVASVSYCMLYFSVLNNGVLMTAYLKWGGVPEGLLGAARGAGAILGIAGAQMRILDRAHCNTHSLLPRAYPIEDLTKKCLFLRHICVSTHATASWQPGEGGDHPDLVVLLHNGRGHGAIRAHPLAGDEPRAAGRRGH